MEEQERTERKAQLTEQLERYKAMQAGLAESCEAHAKLQGKIDEAVDEYCLLDQPEPDPVPEEALAPEAATPVPEVPETPEARRERHGRYWAAAGGVLLLIAGFGSYGWLATTAAAIAGLVAGAVGVAMLFT
ncbi:hypothetical protein ACFYYM_35790 [Streptomyces erythrochromogenes]|uniref:hypothetical protein n=2 Tax=Streptomyces erythrochromogenes TaxID=285574 RepID=UPI0036C3EC53